MEEGFGEYLQRAALGVLMIRGTILCYVLVVETRAVAYGLRKYYYCLE